MLAFLTIFIVCLASISGASWWAACAGAGVLTTISLNSQFSEITETLYGVRTLDLYYGVAASILNGSAAGAMSFGLGRAIAWAWGV